MWTRCLGGFSVMWVTKLLISPVKKRIICPKTTKFGPKLAFLVSLGQAMQAYLVPCWWVDWWLWRAGCISQDTYLLYLLSYSVILQGFLIDLIIGLNDMAPVGRVWLSKFWKDSVNLEKTKRLEKRPPWAQKMKFWSPKKKEISRPNTIGSCFFAKKRTHFGQIQPPQPCL